MTRAVRTPTHFDRGIRAPFVVPDLPVRGLLRGSPMADSESVRAYEAGVRRRLGKHLTLDAAGFSNDYRGLLNAPLGEVVIRNGMILVEAIYANQRQTRSHGVETAVQWDVHPRWHLSGSHSWYAARHALPAAAVKVPFAGDPSGRDPAHMVQGRVSADLSRRMSFDVWAYRQTELRLYGVAPYTRVDGRWSWRLGPEVELSAGIRNALHPTHVEHVSEDYVKSAVRRTAYVRMDWTWGAR